MKELQDEIADSIRQRAKEDGIDDLDVLFMSAVTGEGVNEVLGKVVELLAATAKEAAEQEIVPEPVKWGQSKSTPIRVSREDGVFVVQAQELERLVGMADTRDRRVLLQLWDQMTKNGVARMLEDAGIEAGDTIRIGNSEIGWF